MTDTQDCRRQGRSRRVAHAMRPITAIVATALVAACGGGGGGGAVIPVPAPAPTPTPAARDTFGCLVGDWQVAGGMPVETRYQTEHFAFHWTGSAMSDSDAVKAGRLLESVYAFYATKVGFKPPQCETTTKSKINVNVSEVEGTSFAGSRNGVGYMDLTALGARIDHTLAHELAHVFQSATPGWQILPQSFWETHANFMVAQTPELRADIDCSEDAVNSAYLAHGNARTRYCGWQFWDYVAQKYGYAAVNDVWTKATAATPDQYAALMATRGWSLAQLNDAFADWAVHNVTWDYTGPEGFDRGATFRAGYGADEPDTAVAYRARRLTTLEPIDRDRRRFAVPRDWAPQRWGYNMVRLVPDAGAGAVTVTFRGVIQAAAAATLPGAAGEPNSIPAPASGWRWSVVVVDAQGAPRYSTVRDGSDGSLTVALQPGDRTVYLMVLAAPASLQHIADDQPYYSIYRYPWMVQIDGAMPWGYQPGAPDRIQGGRRHPNGNGWVAAGADVAATAYVGPYARVYGGTVTGNARIEDHAIVASGIVRDDAWIGALTTLAGTATLTQNARLAGVFGTVAGNGFTLSGTAQLRGDVQIYGDVRQTTAPIFSGFSRGVFYGMILQSDATSAARGSNRTEAVREVTADPAFIWR